MAHATSALAAWLAGLYSSLDVSSASRLGFPWDPMSSQVIGGSDSNQSSVHRRPLTQHHCQRCPFHLVWLRVKGAQRAHPSCTFPLPGKISKTCRFHHLG